MTVNREKLAGIALALALTLAIGGPLWSRYNTKQVKDALAQKTEEDRMAKEQEEIRRKIRTPIPHLVEVGKAAGRIYMEANTEVGKSGKLKISEPLFGNGSVLIRIEVDTSVITEGYPSGSYCATCSDAATRFSSNLISAARNLSESVPIGRLETFGMDRGADYPVELTYTGFANSVSVSGDYAYSRPCSLRDTTPCKVGDETIVIKKGMTIRDNKVLACLRAMCISDRMCARLEKANVNVGFAGELLQETSAVRTAEISIKISGIGPTDSNELADFKVGFFETAGIENRG